MKAIYLLSKESFDMIYSLKTRKKISELVEILGHYDKESIFSTKDQLKDVEVIFSGWSAVFCDEKLLEVLPNLKLILYGAGSIKKVQTDIMWQKGIRINSAASLNAIPVANYTISLINLCAKNFFKMVKKNKEEKGKKVDVFSYVKGYYNRKIGILSYSKIGKLVVDKLLETNNEIYIYDPYLSFEEAKKLGLIKSDLEKIFKECDIISIHSPLLEATEKMVDRGLLENMKKDAFLINTARGKIIDSKALKEVFLERKDLTAILDVVDPEPLEKESPLYDMENIIMSPHIAGSLGNEIYAMGDLMLEELTTYLKSGFLKHEITREEFEHMA